MLHDIGQLETLTACPTHTLVTSRASGTVNAAGCFEEGREPTLTSVRRPLCWRLAARALHARTQCTVDDDSQ